jgi:hypothetical protein
MGWKGSGKREVERESGIIQGSTVNMSYGSLRIDLIVSMAFAFVDGDYILIYGVQ